MGMQNATAQLLTVPALARAVGVSEGTVRRYILLQQIFPDATARAGSNQMMLFRSESVARIRQVIFPNPPAQPVGISPINPTCP